MEELGSSLMGCKPRNTVHSLRYLLLRFRSGIMLFYYMIVVIESVQDSVAQNVEDLDADQKPGSKFVPRQSPSGLDPL